MRLYALHNERPNYSTQGKQKHNKQNVWVEIKDFKFI